MLNNKKHPYSSQCTQVSPQTAISSMTNGYWTIFLFYLNDQDVKLSYWKLEAELNTKGVPVLFQPKVVKLYSFVCSGDNACAENFCYPVSNVTHHPMWVYSFIFYCDTCQWLGEGDECMVSLDWGAPSHIAYLKPQHRKYASHVDRMKVFE